MVVSFFMLSMLMAAVSLALIVRDWRGGADWLHIIERALGVCGLAAVLIFLWIGLQNAH